MSIMTDALTTLGANLPLVAVGCAEALAAAALAGKALMLRGRSRPGAGLVSSVQDRDIQRAMMLENGEVSIVLRREDMMPLAGTGDPEALLGVSFSSLQNDIVNLNAAFHDKYMARRAWQRYQDWNGEGMLDETLQLRELGNRLYDMFAKQLQERGIHYEVNLEDMTIDSVEGDELRISQVIINFLSNAVKFTSRGEIIVTIRQMMLRDNAADLMFRVHDTGIGMEHEFLNRIFRPFEQESIETGKKFGGTGLGMAITDQLVRLMGGEIVVDSARGKGSDFTVFLHLPVAEKAAASSAAVPAKEPQQRYDSAFRGCRILMAEDNEINAMIAVEILGEMGAEVESVENGRKAVEAFESHPAGWYDFILMDVQMPEMDGRTAARTIRALGRPDAATIPIFALSADAFVEDERLSIQSGMNGHFAKPVDFAALQQSIGECLAQQEEKG